MAALVFQSNQQPDHAEWLAHALVGSFSGIYFRRFCCVKAKPTPVNPP